PSSAFELPPQFVKDHDLTPTEAKVLLQLAFGYRNSEIAQMLNISKSYIHNLRSKLRTKLPLKPDEELEDYAAALRKTYEPTTKPADSRTSA
ncbi:MAG: helix-turn-helix transcriptional regulator, partial [Schleiferiaceae bacterium]